MLSGLKHWFSVACLSFAALAVQAQAGARFDSSLVETGEAFQLHLSVAASTGQPLSVDFSPWDSIFPPANILRQSGWQQVGNAWQNDVTLITFDSADRALPPLPIRLRDGRTELTNALTLSVIGTPAPEQVSDIADIEDIRREPFHWTDALPWVLLVGGLLALAALIYWLLTRKRVVRPRAAEPAHELALRRLDALAQRRLWQGGQLKTYYAELTHIVRAYLQQRYAVPALESASEEILDQLPATDFPLELRPTLTELLHQADLVKFAKGIPPPGFHEAAWQQARQLVQQTAVVARPASEPATLTPKP